VPLTDKAIKALKPGPKARKVSDGAGLFLLVNTDGSKWWRFKYRFEGREKMISVGVYPDTGLALARDKRDDARRLLAAGINPSAHRAAQKTAVADSFEAVAREWYAKEAPSWVAAHGKRILTRLENDVFPRMGTRPVSQVTAPEILAVVRRIVDRKAVETAHRALANIGQVMRFAVATGRAPSDPTTALRGALPSPNATHHAAITDPTALGALLRAIAGYQGSPVVRAALRLAPHVFVRPGELRHAEWAEIDFKAQNGALWTIPGAKMKGGADHCVPLSSQSVAILREIAPLTERSRFVFPGARSYHKPLSENAVIAALRYLDYDKETVTGHGFRATARTLLDEALGHPPHLIEHQLAHSVRDPLGRAYNRTSHLPERRVMMQRWSDYLDGLRDNAGNVVPIRRKHTK
jgi:integrase